MSPIQKKLLNWFSIYGRDLPWRKTYTPYHIWISEIMLQQTQMKRATAYFNHWMEKFPDITNIAKSSEEELMKLWEGLGYYSRARNIFKTAKILVQAHNSELPADHKTLLKLPGIGRYTAGAIMSLAFNQEYAIVDANIERLYARLFNIDTPVKSKENQHFIWRQAKELIPQGKARYFNQALMELGGLICLPKNPKCGQCPISGHCAALGLKVTDKRPVPVKLPDSISIEMVTGLLAHNGKIFIQKRPENDAWGGLWEFPTGRLKRNETPEQALKREYQEKTELKINDLKKITTVKHSYTKYRVTLHCFSCGLENVQSKPTLHAAQEYRWVIPKELARFAFPAGHRKLIDFIHANRHHLALDI